MINRKKRTLILTSFMTFTVFLCLPASGCSRGPKDTDFDPVAIISTSGEERSSSAAESGTPAAADEAKAKPTEADNGSGESETSAHTPGEAVTFQDALGRQVTVSSPERTAVLIGSFADIWCLAGGKDSLVAAAHDTWTNFDLGLDDSVADLGLITEPNLETLAAAQPDFIIASSNTDADVKMLDTLESMGMNVAYFQVSNFKDYLNMLDICTQITGDRDRYETYGQALAAQIEDAKSMADGSAPTVLYVRASSSSCKVKNSKGSVLGEMLSDLGCVNIADSDGSLLEDLNMEAIVAADPRFIFVVLQGADSKASMNTLEKELLSSPVWQSLTAVKEGRYHILDRNLYNLKPNARWGEAYENLAKILYPHTSKE